MQIESLPYEQILEKYDRPTTVFYLDPPYWERKLYKFNFSETDFLNLEQRLRALQGKFILSLDDRPEVRELFATIPHADGRSGLHRQARTRARHKELLISEFRSVNWEWMPRAEPQLFAVRPGIRLAARQRMSPQPGSPACSKRRRKTSG